MKIAICEDDSLQAGALEKMLKKRFEIASYENSIDVYLSAEDMKRGLENAKYDAYFLDIELGNDNGVELARYIKGYDINSVIIFTTSHTDYMSAAFDVHAFNYIVKPVTEDKVDKIVTQLEQIMYAAEEKLVFSCNRQTMMTLCIWNQQRELLKLLQQITNIHSTERLMMYIKNCQCLYSEGRGVDV